MKRNKLVIAMGLAGAVLMGCHSGGHPDKVDITAIDGYIVNGIVTMKCGDDVFMGRTNEFGVASIDTLLYSVTDCTSSITGDDLTYDSDFPEKDWFYSMEGVPGAAVINPFTTIAALVRKTPGKENFTDAELKLEVAKIIGLDDLALQDVDMFGDYGRKSTATTAQVALAAASTFDAIVATEEKLKGTTVNNAETKVAILSVAAKTVMKKVKTEIDKASNSGKAFNNLTIEMTVDLSAVDTTSEGVTTETILAATTLAADKILKTVKVIEKVTATDGIVTLKEVETDIATGTETETVTVIKPPVVTGATGSSS